MLTGERCFEAFNRLPGLRLGGTHWTIWSWLAIQPVKVLQVGGIIGGVGQVLHIVYPLSTEYVPLSVGLWCVVVAITVAALVSFRGYQFIERTSLALLASFTVMTLVCVVALQWTPYAISAADIASGLKFHVPSGALFFVIGAFGLTGVGGDEIMYYNYWLIEKGYAAQTGACQADDPAWQRRARGWIRVMYLDALLSMVLYTLVTSAFYVLGAAVLHAESAIPEGFAMIETLATVYTRSLGPWARDVFLAGAFVVLFSTLFAALAAWTRIFTDAFGQVGLIDFDNLDSRRRTIFALSWAFPFLWTASYFLYSKPVAMVMIGGVGTSLMLLIVVVAALYFRYRGGVAALRPGWCYDAALWLSVVAIVGMAVYSIAKT
ncbi:MAG: Nramp family divalent metal transporter, partial [Planctomycetota bacterium]